MIISISNIKALNRESRDIWVQFVKEKYRRRYIRSKVEFWKYGEFQNILRGQSSWPVSLTRVGKRAGVSILDLARYLSASGRYLSFEQYLRQTSPLSFSLSSHLSSCWIHCEKKWSEAFSITEGKTNTWRLKLFILENYKNFQMSNQFLEW